MTREANHETLINIQMSFIEQATLLLLLSTWWFQERFRAWVHKQTKINGVPYGRLMNKSNKPHR